MSSLASIVWSLVLFGVTGLFSLVAVFWWDEWRDRRRWRQRARERGQPLCKRCRLPEDHWDHGSYGDCNFNYDEGDHG
jgi:hypothetical protein